MIVGEDFVWMHFPKCAGHTIDRALQVLRGRRDVAFDVAEAGWHDSIQDRADRRGGFDPAGKTIICGFRRLPHWLLSRVHYDASRPPYRMVSRQMLCQGQFYEEDGVVQSAEAYVKHYRPSRVDRWVRTEHLDEDFQRHFGDILDSQLARAAVRRLAKVFNGTRINYVRSLDFYFTSEELDGLYAANPTWAALEARLYGDVLRLGGPGAN
jgi:hypothetical protein